jgi:hypothetical protein
MLDQIVREEEGRQTTDDTATNQKRDSFETSDVAKECQEVVSGSSIHSSVKVSEHAESRDFVTRLKVVNVGQTQLCEFVTQKCAYFLQAKIKVADLVLHTLIIHIGKHPVGLSLVDVLVPNERLVYDTTFIVNRAIESLVVLVDDELRPAQVIPQFFQGLFTASIVVVLRWFARHKVDVEGDTFDFIHASDSKLLISVDAPQNFLFF